MSQLANGAVRPALSADLLSAAKGAVAAATSATFHPDPLLGPGLSHTVSVLGSTVKRHGVLLERGIAEALERSDRYIVERNVTMPITMAADALVARHSPGELGHLSIASDTESRRTVFVDMIAVDVDKGRALIVEIKRGSGATELKKRRYTETLLRAARLQGKSFLRGLSYEVDTVEAVVIDYCGRSGFPPDLTVTRDGLDAFFAVPVVATIEAMTGVMQRELREILPGLLNLARGGEVTPVDTGFENHHRA